jgi:phage terminase Nu1 subunit (DNA packaging protein)
MANRGKADIELASLNQQQIAFICGVTSRSVRDWADAPRNSDGTYNAQEFVAWFLQRSSGGAGEKEYNNQRERLAAAQAEKVETENKVRRGELADTKQMIELWSGVLAAVRAKLLSLPTKLGPQLVNTSDPAIIVGRIRTEVYSTLDELAGDSTEVSVDSEITADSDGERMV